MKMLWILSFSERVLYLYICKPQILILDVHPSHLLFRWNSLKTEHLCEYQYAYFRFFTNQFILPIYPPYTKHAYKSMSTFYQTHFYQISHLANYNTCPWEKRIYFIEILQSYNLFKNSCKRFWYYIEN